ncbi:hypothetical protein MVEN_00226300 [Mycena venus]|uniref:Uncharacterized protein n=1 Tax=Mycena venus TaxID=2733690 RepID=A0A8H7DDI5_9AGAR|nr:hypothetical protein MVEN_00226300 [Mycena venus]
MVYVRSRKFCCCLPVRFGVFVMSLGALLLGGLVAIAGWLQVKALPQHPIAKDDEHALYIYAVMFSILALVGGFGFIGTLSKQRGARVYLRFHARLPPWIQHCDRHLRDLRLKIVKILVVVGYCVTWLIELWGVLIVNAYVKQLKEEMANVIGAVNPNAPMQHYVPPPANGYAFTQPGQAMGHQG